MGWGGVGWGGVGWGGVGWWLERRKALARGSLHKRGLCGGLSINQACPLDSHQHSPAPPNAHSCVQVLLIENDINTNPFTQAVHACVPPLPWSVGEADLADPNRWAPLLGGGLAALAASGAWGRRCGQALCGRCAGCSGPGCCSALTVPRCALCRADLRHLAVCSVDPPGCKDIDDALHVRRLPNGNFELGEWRRCSGVVGLTVLSVTPNCLASCVLHPAGVHIADVTNFVHPGTAMDEEASARWGVCLAGRYLACARSAMSTCLGAALSTALLSDPNDPAACPACLLGCLACLQGHHSVPGAAPH